MNEKQLQEFAEASRKELMAAYKRGYEAGYEDGISQDVMDE